MSMPRPTRENDKEIIAGSAATSIRQLSPADLNLIDMDRESQSQRLKQARQAAGFKTAAEAARRFGWNPVAYRHHENGTAGFRAAQAEAYAKAYSIPVEWLMFGKGAVPPSPAGEIHSQRPPIPVLGSVAAGVWKEIPEADPDETLKFLPGGIVGVPDGARAFALRVEGPSMNLFYPHGRYIIVSPSEDVGLRYGDHVVVRRSRAGLFETTVKELQRIGDRVALVPRSDDPAYQEPVYLDLKEHDQDAPQIMFVVLGDYSARTRPDTPPFDPITGR